MPKVFWLLCDILYEKKITAQHSFFLSLSFSLSLSHSISLSTFSNLNRTMFPGLFNSEKNICVHFCWKRIRNKWGDFFSCCSVKSTQLYRWENITPFPVYLRVLRRTTVRVCSINSAVTDRLTLFLSHDSELVHNETAGEEPVCYEPLARIWSGWLFAGMMKEGHKGNSLWHFVW